ncbi:MAG: hypothetical protein JO316_06155 [Abitibacteriaceae bacterium]|nr:hypothetical protein [Abditibacteriaceae bacterium]MBV9864913.1 hypothetical protein [Abditibacteriaceae bacterium]
MGHSTLTLVVAFVWIGFSVCVGLLLWTRMVKASSRRRVDDAPRPGDDPDAIVQHMHQVEMEARGAAVRDRMQTNGPQLGLGIICILLFLFTMYFSRGR